MWLKLSGLRWFQPVTSMGQRETSSSPVRNRRSIWMLGHPKTPWHYLRTRYKKKNCVFFFWGIALDCRRLRKTCGILSVEKHLWHGLLWIDVILLHDIYLQLSQTWSIAVAGDSSGWLLRIQVPHPNSNGCQTNHISSHKLRPSPGPDKSWFKLFWNMYSSYQF